MTQTLYDPTQGMPLQQQVFGSNIMETLQTTFDSTQGFDPNMTYTSQGVTSFDSRQKTPTPTYDQTLEFHMLLIEKLQNKIDKESKKVQSIIKSMIKQAHDMGKPYDRFSRSYIYSLIDTSKLPKLLAKLTMAKKKFNQILEYDQSNPIPFESSYPPTISE